jgi:hypothetical protein
VENNIPKITTKQTEYLRLQYPCLSHLEAGNIAEWLQERKDQLFEMARSAENEADMTRVLLTFHGMWKRGLVRDKLSRSNPLNLR